MLIQSKFCTLFRHSVYFATRHIGLLFTSHLAFEFIEKHEACIWKTQWWNWNNNSDFWNLFISEIQRIVINTSGGFMLLFTSNSR